MRRSKIFWDRYQCETDHKLCMVANRLKKAGLITGLHVDRHHVTNVLLEGEGAIPIYHPADFVDVVGKDSHLQVSRIVQQVFHGCGSDHVLHLESGTRSGKVLATAAKAPVVTTLAPTIATPALVTTTDAQSTATQALNPTITTQAITATTATTLVTAAEAHASPDHEPMSPTLIDQLLSDPVYGSGIVNVETDSEDKMDDSEA